MQTTSTLSRVEQTAPEARELGGDRRRFLWLGLGAVLWLFSVGGRWDLPLAAWLFSVFLLRFSRNSRPLAGISLVWLAAIAAALFWAWELAIPMPLTTIAACVALGTVFMLPYLLDRLLTPRLGLIGRLLLFPAALAACEFLIGIFSPLGTAYGLLAVTQYANLPLLQVIAVTGPYAIGFLIGWFATVVNFVWEGPLSWPRVRGVTGLYAAVFGVVLVGGGVRLAFFPPAATYVRVAGISPSRAASAAQLSFIPVSPAAAARANPAPERAAYGLVHDELFADTRQAAQAGAKIVVWSENAAVLVNSDEPAFLAQAAGVARQEHIYLLVADNVPFVRDETHLFDPSGRLMWTYEKAHPVFGLETYKPGDGKVPVVQTPYGQIAGVICYDADFPALMRVQTNLMLIPAGDWPEMGRVHTLRMAKLRSIENGYSLLRQDFDGLSAVFDYEGNVVATQDTTTSNQNLMIAEMPTSRVPTIYRLMGDTFAWLCVAGTVLLAGMGLLRRRSSSG